MKTGPQDQKDESKNTFNIKGSVVQRKSGEPDVNQTWKSSEPDVNLIQHLKQQRTKSENSRERKCTKYWKRIKSQHQIIEATLIIRTPCH